MLLLFVVFRNSYYSSLGKKDKEVTKGLINVEKVLDEKLAEVIGEEDESLKDDLYSGLAEKMKFGVWFYKFRLSVLRKTQACFIKFNIIFKLSFISFGCLFLLFPQFGWISGVPGALFLFPSVLVVSKGYDSGVTALSLA